MEPATDAIAQRWAAIRQQNLDTQNEAAIPETKYRHIAAPAQSANTLIEVFDNTSPRFKFGIRELDLITRGCDPGEFTLLVGYSHSGKTQILLNAICNQPDEPILFFSYDDPAEMVLLKLVCIAEQTSAVQLERELRAGNQETRELLKRHARTTFRNLVIVDEPVPLDAMGDAVAEAQHWFEKPLRAIFLDYLKLLPAEDEYANEYQNVMRKAYQLKMWAKDQSAPLLVIHQGTRSGAKPGHPITLTSGAFGGEEYANLVIGCRRKRDNDTLEPWERQRHQDTITAHVVKNKRPPCKITPPEGIDLHIDATTGLIRPLSDDDFYLANDYEQSELTEPF